MKIVKLLVIAAVLSAGVWSLAAQEAEDRTLLSWAEMRAIINEASGERAMHHVLELVPYPRVRPLSEYQGHFRESEVMARFAREYGLSEVAIESFPSPQRLWQPTQGELWMLEPQVRKLYDIYDVAVSLAANSPTGEVTAELVDVGAGRPQDFERADVAGKFVLASGGTGGQVYQLAVQRGAVGVIGYSSLRPDDYPDQIPSSSVPANATAPGWAVAPRVGRELAGLLSRGQRVRLRSIVKAETFPGELEVVHATIPGDGSTDQAVAVSAHLYEGYLKQGANDDNSGCALTLEIARAYRRLVDEGKLPKPRRTVHFLWVPEISGTNAWLDAHPEVEKRLIADLNFDMEGIRLATSRSFWVLHRTPDTFPSFLNDVAQSVMEFVAELNRERVRYRSVGYSMTLPVVAPNGSFDPFYIKVDKHYGASDHVTYMQRGIPSVMFITWPDMWYHSSQDTPDKQDPTQYKRAAVVGIGALAVLAGAGDELAARVTAESIARGAERMGAALRKGLGYLADAATGADLPPAFHEARVAVRHQAAVEKAVVRSSAVLYTNPEAARKKLAPFEALVDQRAGTLVNEAQAFYKLAAEQRGVPAVEPTPTPLEQEAARLLVERVAGAGGRGGGPGGGRGAGAAAAGGETFQAAQAALARIPQHMRAELAILVGQKKTALEIRDFLSGEFEPLPLADLMAYLRAQEKIGAIKLTELPPPAPAKKK
jgi:aminopeptidase YwaD